MSNKKTNKAAEATEQLPDVEQQNQEATAPEQATEQVAEQPEKEKPAGKTEKPATSAKTPTTATAAKEKLAKTGSGALTAVGKAACKRHKLPHVWVTNDGQAFANENDAKAHAKNLPNSETIKVTA